MDTCKVCGAPGKILSAKYFYAGSKSYWKFSLRCPKGHIWTEIEYESKKQQKGHRR